MVQAPLRRWPLGQEMQYARLPGHYPAIGKGTVKLADQVLLLTYEAASVARQTYSSQ